MNVNIIVGLAYEHTSMDPVLVQKLDAKAMLLVFSEDEEFEEICITL